MSPEPDRHPAAALPLEVRILEMLRAGEGSASGEAMCRELGISRAAVWKHINTLRQQGYTIAACTRRGYHLAATPETPVPGELLPRLHTRWLGRPYEFLPSVDSTNHVVTTLAERGADAGTTVAADTQTGGRGRMGRQWHSPAGANLYLSLLLRPTLAPMQIPPLALVCGLAIHRAVQQVAPGLNTAVKWPNDVWLEGRKLAGVLCEMRCEADRVHFLVVGLGINVNLQPAQLPPALAPAATSLALAAGRTFCRTELLAALLNALEPLYERWLADGLAPFVDELAACSPLTGRAVAVNWGNERLCGTVTGLATSGALLLETAPGVCREIVAGDVHLEV